jgi:hypothetical protein
VCADLSNEQYHAAGSSPNLPTTIIALIKESGLQMRPQCNIFQPSSRSWFTSGERYPASKGRAYMDILSGLYTQAWRVRQPTLEAATVWQTHLDLDKTEGGPFLWKPVYETKFCQWMHQGFFMRSKHKPEGKKGTDHNTPARLQQSRFSPFRVPNIVPKPF